MALPNAGIDWKKLRPRILRDLGDGFTQEAVRKRLAEDPNNTFRVSISKSQLETQLKKWGYRNSLSVNEWRFISPRIKKRRDAGKRSQVIVNGFTFGHAKVSKAIDRYDLSTGESVPPEILEGLNHDSYVIQTPPSSPDLRSRLPGSSVSQTGDQNTAALLRFPGRVWPPTAMWLDIERLVDKFIAQFVVPNYQQAGRFLNVYHDIASHLSSGGLYSDRSESIHIQVHKASSQARVSDTSLGSCEGVADHPYDVLQASRDPHIRRIFVGTLLVLFFDLSTNPFGLKDKSLVTVIEGFAWDELIPPLKTLLSEMDSGIAQAFIQGLFTVSIRKFNLKLLTFSFGLGADPAWDIQISPGRRIPTLIDLCDIRRRGTEYTTAGLRELVRYLLSKGAPVTKHIILWIINAQYYTVAEDIIRLRPTLGVDFVVLQPIHEFELLRFPRAFRAVDPGFPRFLSMDRHTPLTLTLSDARPSIEKLSLLRCLLERNAEPDLAAMVVAAESHDVQAVILLHKNGAPLDGCYSSYHSPLSIACQYVGVTAQPIALNTLSILLILGASPNPLANCHSEPPLHCLVRFDHAGIFDKTIEAMNLLIIFGADINYHASRSQLRWKEYRGRYSNGSYNHESSEEFVETILELAISETNWGMASHILSLGCELTGREIIFFSSTLGGYESRLGEASHDNIRQFFRTWLVKAQLQTHNHQWSKLSVFETAIKNGNQEMIMALLDVGMAPSLSDVVCMLRSPHLLSSKVSLLDSSIQMSLIGATRYFQSPITDMSIFRLVLKGACREVIQHVLERDSGTYDSKGLCIAIARYLTKDNLPFSPRSYEKEGARYPDMREISMLISRRRKENSDEVWENTAIMMAVRAGHVDILGLLTGSGQHSDENTEHQNTGLIPSFILKSYLDAPQEDSESDLSTDPEEQALFDVRNWLAYCEMDDPHFGCSPLTAAAAASDAIAEEAIKYLLSCHYQPDGWTVLVASAQGRLGILEHLSGLECWPQILKHGDRPDWCPTALQMAVSNGHVDVVNFLIDAGLRDTFHAHDLAPTRPCRNFVPTYWGDYRTLLRPRTSLQHAIQRFQEGNMNLIKSLVEAGAIVNAPAAEDSGATALQIASMRGFEQVVRYLLGHGADPNAEAASKHGRTALQGAAEGGHEDVVKLLLDANASKADEHIEDYAKAVIYAQQNYYEHVVKLLCERWRQGDIKQTEVFHLLSEEWEVSSADDSTFEEFEKPLKDDSEFEDLRERIKNWQKSFEN